MRYNNYHKHTHYSNIMTTDSMSKPIDYINRAKELGSDIYFTTEHGWGGNVYEAFTLCQKNDMKLVFGAEVYYVMDNSEKDERGYHLVLIAMNENGRHQMNKILSQANTEGYYYHPRVDKVHVLSLNPNDVVVTTACIAGPMFKGNWEEDFYNPMRKHFGDHFYLEVQDHNHPSQIELNKKILDLHYRDGVKLIHGCDSHYISDSYGREVLLKAKGMNYGDEGSFILDYPSSDEILERYKEQGVLREDEALEALENTLIFDSAEPVYLDKEIKLPKIIKGDSNKHLRKLINKEFKNKILCQDLDAKTKQQYLEAVRYEMKIIEDCHMADYFILNYYIVKRAKELGGILTRSGRGCFTDKALVLTDTGYKSIKDVQIGDRVISADGKFHMVEDTFEYDIDEPMMKIRSEAHPSDIECTQDHRILVKRNDEIEYVKAKDINHSDLFCFPKSQEDSISYSSEDDDFYYIKPETIEQTDKSKTKVYDLQIEEEHSFVVNNIAVHNSGVSFLINYLLGFTEIDRMKAPVRLFPTRFMSTERILASKSLPD